MQTQPGGLAFATQDGLLTSDGTAAGLSAFQDFGASQGDEYLQFTDYGGGANVGRPHPWHAPLQRRRMQQAAGQYALAQLRQAAGSTAGCAALWAARACILARVAGGPRRAPYCCLAPTPAMRPA